MVDGIEYSKLYYDSRLQRLIGINLGEFKPDGNGNMIHVFQPKQTIISPNNNGRYIIRNPNNLNQSYPYPPYP